MSEEKTQPQILMEYMFEVGSSTNLKLALTSASVAYGTNIPMPSCRRIMNRLARQEFLTKTNVNSNSAQGIYIVPSEKQMMAFINSTTKMSLVTKQLRKKMEAITNK